MKVYLRGGPLDGHVIIIHEGDAIYFDLLRFSAAYRNSGHFLWDGTPIWDFDADATRQGDQHVGRTTSDRRPCLKCLSSARV
jgi:hypothetical protein